jgi:hypothetical protein
LAVGGVAVEFKGYRKHFLHQNAQNPVIFCIFLKKSVKKTRFFAKIRAEKRSKRATEWFFASYFSLKLRP